MIDHLVCKYDNSNKNIKFFESIENVFTKLSFLFFAYEVIVIQNSFIWAMLFLHRNFKK